VIGSLNGTSLGGWVRHATRLQETGVDAIELNLYDVVADPAVGAAEVEGRYLELIAAVKAAVRLPVAVKIGPSFTALAGMAVRMVAAGADGLVLFNRFWQPDIELATLSVQPRLRLSTSDELHLPLRWTAILHGRVRASLALSSGVHSGADAAKALLAGADVAMLIPHAGRSAHLAWPPRGAPSGRGGRTGRPSSQADSTGRLDAVGAGEGTIMHRMVGT
jgi:dihydroorotate dehydrogenase (fumarate)